jgi:hypothetical protein
MQNPGRGLLTVVLIALAFAGGYAFAAGRLRAEVPPRALPGAALDAGTALDLQKILLDPNDFERTAQVAALLAPLGSGALPAVRQAYDSVVLDVGDVEIVQLVQWWGRFDPEAAFEWARDSKIGWHPAAIAAAIRAWARRDPQTASQQLLARVQDERMANVAMIGLVRGWEESGRAGLGEFLASAPKGSEALFALGVDAYVRGRILREGPQAAIAWVEAIPDGEDGKPTPFKQRAFQEAATLVVDYDPQAAGAFAARHRGPAWGIGLLLRVGMAWAARDGAAAMQWLQSLPPGREVPPVVQETYRKWFTVDLPAASRWLEAQPPAPWLDPAISTHALWRTRESFDDALRWAERVHDQERRDVTYGKIGLAWFRADPAAAQAWLDGAEYLTPAARERIESLRKLRIRPQASPQGKPQELDPFQDPFVPDAAPAAHAPAAAAPTQG